MCTDAGLKMKREHDNEGEPLRAGPSQQGREHEAGRDDVQHERREHERER